MLFEFLKGQVKQANVKKADEVHSDMEKADQMDDSSYMAMIELYTFGHSRYMKYGILYFALQAAFFESVHA